MLGHLENLYSFYGEYTGLRVARKHLSWYSSNRIDGLAFRAAVNRAESAREQLALSRSFIERLANLEQTTT